MKQKIIIQYINFKVILKMCNSSIMSTKYQNIFKNYLYKNKRKKGYKLFTKESMILKQELVTI